MAKEGMEMKKIWLTLSATLCSLCMILSSTKVFADSEIPKFETIMTKLLELSDSREGSALHDNVVKLYYLDQKLLPFRDDLEQLRKGLNGAAWRSKGTGINISNIINHQILGGTLEHLIPLRTTVELDMLALRAEIALKKPEMVPEKIGILQQHVQKVQELVKWMNNQMKERQNDWENVQQSVERRIDDIKLKRDQEYSGSYKIGSKEYTILTDINDILHSIQQDVTNTKGALSLLNSLDNYFIQTNSKLEYITKCIKETQTIDEAFIIPELDTIQVEWEKSMDILQAFN